MTETLREDHDLGLPHDLNKMLKRRDALRLFASAGSAALTAGVLGCSESTGGASTSASSSSASSSSSSSSSASSASSSASCIADPTETNGPYPADGTNSANGSVANVLTQSGVVRTDIRSSFGGYTGTADGARLDLTITVVDVNNACAPLEGYAVYVWHCDADGDYSIYNLANENYLRGVGVTDSNGQVTFTTIFPGCYMGRYPHIHFEVYPSLSKATAYANRALVSQFAMPENECTSVYNNISTYSGSISAYAASSISSDNVFSDNTSSEIAAQTPTLSGDAYTGYTGDVTVGIAV